MKRIIEKLSNILGKVDVEAVKPAVDEKIKLDKKIILLIDILGFSDYVLDMCPGDAKECQINKLYSYLNENVSGGDCQYEVDQNHHIRCNIKSGVTFFSDTILIFYDYKDSENIALRCPEDLFEEIQADAAKIQYKVFELLGLLIRGCVHFGDAFYSFESSKGQHAFFYGSGIIKAYQGENKIAIYPRIILSKEALNYYVDNNCHGANRSFERDLDGIYFFSLFEKYDEDQVEYFLFQINEKLNKESYDDKILQKWNWFITKLNKFIE